MIALIRIALLASVVWLSASQATSATEIDFNRDIRPILSDNCFRCHGPDAGERQTELRLDVKESAFGELDSGGRGIVAGNAAASELITRITADDPDERMPPLDAGKSLSSPQIELLRKWVETGASWNEHWAFVAPQRPRLPRVENRHWPLNPIDYFSLARLEFEGWLPAAEADKRTLIRRVTFDLTGFAPTPAEVDAFLQDSAPDAYERVVDRLLNSPRYGEHRARYWLDAARYGDTHGLHLDNERTIWPYRNWVIDSFNQNMGFDQFTIEQLAGDLLPNPTLSQRVATGFNRCNVTTSEGGSIDQEYLVRYAVDRVETTSTVWMGFTAGCAACHDHKFDPLSQEEFYQLFAYFYSQTERAMDGNALLPPPSVKTASITQQVKRRQLEQQRLQTQRARRQIRDTAVDRLPEWAEAHLRSSEKPTLPTDAIVHCRFDENEGERISTGNRQTGNVVGDAMWDAGKLRSGLRFDGQTYVELGELAAVDKDDRFSFGGWVYPTGEGALTVLSKMSDDDAFRGYDLYLGGGRAFVHLIHDWDENAIRVNTKGKLSLNAWQHVFVTYDGSAKAAGVKVFVDGVEEELEVTHDRLAGSIQTDASFKIGRRTPSAPFQGSLDEIRFYRRTLSADEVRAIVGADPIAEILAVPATEWSAEQREQLLDAFLEQRDANYRELSARLRRQRDQIRRIEGAYVSTLVMQEMSQPRVAHVLRRGQYDQPGEPVVPAVPAVLPPMSAEMPANRLGLAQWLVSPNHPLTARVTINRIWQQHFGIGLVETAEDFGSQGQWPSHPAMLDWLAVEFVQGGWDIKAMHRLIVTSATYRQSSVASAAAYRRDPENRLLARGPRYRMDAEMIRDHAIAVSGLLVERLGGKSVKPYQPPGLWNAVGYTSSNTARFKQDHGSQLYRRSLYTFWKRTSPPPSMQIFDAPTREVCTVRRPRTNTPAAALVLMNDPQFVEAARHLAQRMLQSATTDAGRVKTGFLLVTSRIPQDDECRILLQMLSHYRQLYAEDGDAGQSLVSVGESQRDESIDVGELAAWTIVASTMLNLDESVTK